MRQSRQKNYLFISGRKLKKIYKKLKINLKKHCDGLMKLKRKFMRKPIEN